MSLSDAYNRELPGREDSSGGYSAGVSKSSLNNVLNDNGLDENDLIDHKDHQKNDQTQNGESGTGGQPAYTRVTFARYDPSADPQPGGHHGPSVSDYHNPKELLTPHPDGAAHGAHVSSDSSSSAMPGDLSGLSSSGDGRLSGSDGEGGASSSVSDVRDGRGEVFTAEPVFENIMASGASSRGQLRGGVTIRRALSSGGALGGRASGSSGGRAAGETSGTGGGEDAAPTARVLHAGADFTEVSGGSGKSASRGARSLAGNAASAGAGSTGGAGEIFRFLRFDKDEENAKKDPSPDEILDAAVRAKAAARLKEAREEADRIVAEAKASADQIRKDAEEQGHKEGYDAGEAAARADVEQEYHARLMDLEDRAKGAMEEIAEAREKILHRYLGELKDIAVAVGEKVIHVSLASSGEVIKRMISAEVEKRRKTAWMKIYMDREDYDRMVKTDTDIADELSRISDNIKCVVMNSEKEGYCIIETPEEVTDISVDTQMENIRDRLQDVTFDNADLGGIEGDGADPAHPEE